MPKFESINLNPEDRESLPKATPLEEEAPIPAPESLPNNEQSQKDADRLAQIREELGIKKYLDPIKKIASIAAISSMLTSSSLVEGGPKEESFEQMARRAKTEMAEKGITSEQSKAYLPGVNDLIYRAIGPAYNTPENSKDWEKTLDLAVKNLIHGRGNVEGDKYEQFDKNPGEEDSWRLYLGFPQKYGTYTVSEYKPSHSKENKYYYAFADLVKGFNGKDIRDPEIVKYILKKMGDREKVSSEEVNQIVVGSRTLYHFQWSKGEDEKGKYIAYYDIWDLNVPIEKDGKGAGKPFEIYDRIYYDPQTIDNNPTR